jgi:hypothetical protein
MAARGALRASAVTSGAEQPGERPDMGHNQGAISGGGSTFEPPHPAAREPFRLLPTSRWWPRTDGPHPPSSWEPSPPGTSIAVLAGRAIRVPEGAVTSGIQRTTTVTRRGPMGWAHGSDLGWEEARNCIAYKGSSASGWLTPWPLTTRRSLGR